jgi:hypothetical protein
MKPITIPVEYRSDEYINDYPTHVEVSISDEVMSKLKKAKKFIGDDYTIEVRIKETFNYYNDGDESDFRVGYSCICLGHFGRAYIYAQNKYDSGVYLETESFNID